MIIKFVFCGKSLFSLALCVNVRCMYFKMGNRRKLKIVKKITTAKKTQHTKAQLPTWISVA